MDKSIIIGTVLGAVGATAVGTVANYDLLDNKPKFAEVLNVEPITETYKVPRQECRDVEVTRRQPSEDKNQLTGTIIGAVVGGIIGKQVGGGNGKKLAAVAAAAAGGFAGKKVQEGMQEKNTYTTTEQQCETVVDTKVNTVGYTVKYQLGDEINTIRMDREPGERIPVSDGKLVLNQLDLDG